MIEVESSKVLKVTSAKSKIMLTVDMTHGFISVNHWHEPRKIEFNEIRTQADLDAMCPSGMRGLTLSCSPILALQNLRKMVDLALAELTKEPTTNRQLHPEGSED